MKALLAATICLLSPAAAWAADYDSCELVIMQFIPDEDGGGADIASFRPAEEFLASVRDISQEPMLTIGDHPIRAIMCVRNDLVPTEDDYPVLATGVMMALSQDFDSSDSDSLTVVYQDGAFRHTYSSAYPMSDEFKQAIETRLADFSARDHGLDDQATQ